jgi:hypothetical protein
MKTPINPGDTVTLKARVKSIVRDDTGIYFRIIPLTLFHECMSIAVLENEINEVIENDDDSNTKPTN